MASPAATFDEASGMFAGFWRRVAASLIDWVILGIVSAVAMMVLGGGMAAIMVSGGGVDDAGSAQMMGVLLYVGLMIVWLAYKAGLECSSRRATLGKMALGIVVTDMNGERISFLTSLWRNWPVWLPAIIYAAGIAVISPETMSGMSSDGTGPAAADAMRGFSLISSAFSLVVVIAYLVVAFTPKKQGLHDMMAKALVVKKSAL
jgi:uncharacterized RDD family membrane protein YckC